MLRRITIGTVVVMAIVLAVSLLTRPDETVRAGLPGPTGETAPAGLTRFYHQEPDWRTCGRYRCTTIRVPLDYAEPTGPTLGLAVRLLPASDGSTDDLLLVNPGGPGGSGVEYVPILASVAGDRVRDRLAIVGVDPRGVGASRPVECLSDRRLDAYVGLDPTPDDAQEERAWLAAPRRLGEGCRRTSGTLVAHMSTQESARDMDVVRAVLGQDRLRYYGASYGTQLGATYASMFPAKVGRLVLDGAVDVGQRRRELLADQLAATEQALTRFLRWCARQDDCPLPKDGRAARAQLVQVAQQADRTPLRSTGDLRPAGEVAVLRGMLSALSSRDSWPDLLASLGRALYDDGTGFRQLDDAYVQREEDGRYRNNSVVSGVAVRCLDDPQDTPVEQVRADLVPRFQQVSAVFGRYFAWAATLCHRWPARGERQETASSSAGSRIMVVGSTRDPVTPYSWSKRLAAALRGSVLVTRVGDGHTAYGRTACVDRAVESFLTSRDTPRKRLTCREGTP